MARPREIAAQMFDEIATEVASHSFDLVSVLKRGWRACELAGMPAEQRWFELELNGYPPTETPPWYRLVRGAEWVQSPLATMLGSAVSHRQPSRSDVMSYSGATNVEQTLAEAARTIVGWAAQGSRGVVEVLPADSQPDRQVRRRMRQFDAWDFVPVVDAIANRALAIATRAHIALAFGDAVEGIWDGLRRQVDAVLPSLGIDRHLDAIGDQIASDNPEHWRAAMWACREVLAALASHLWRDTAPVYPKLKSTDGGPMKVDASKSVNRLRAYLHCKGVAGHEGDYLRAEAERLGDSLHRLYQLDNKAHNVQPVDREDARLAVVATYVLIGQFVRRTDMQPVLDQSTCGNDA